MRKTIYGVLGTGVLLLALFVPGGMNEAFAEIDIQVNISPPPIMVAEPPAVVINIGPPPIMVIEPPAVVMIPNSTIYFVPRVEHDIFFYDNFWWAPRGSQWYRSRAYNGQWEIIENFYVPAPVFKVPKDYRHRYEKEHHIPYGQWKKQWSNQGNQSKGHDKKSKQGKKQGKQGKGHGKKSD